MPTTAVQKAARRRAGPSGISNDSDVKQDLSFHFADGVQTLDKHHEKSKVASFIIHPHCVSLEEDCRFEDKGRIKANKRTQLPYHNHGTHVLAL